MSSQWLKQVGVFISAISEMIQLAWLAHAVIFISSIGLTILQAILPVATAWLLKLLFDMLSQVLRTGLTPEYTHNLMFILILQGCALAAGDTARYFSGFLDAELGRRLVVVIQTQIYRKVGSFAGIRYFEDPKFHDQLRLALQGARDGPEGIVGTISDLLQSFITLMSFIGVLMIFSPLLAGLVALTAIPQFYSRLKMGNQRFDLALSLGPMERRLYYYNFVLSDPQTAKENRLFGLVEYFINKLMEIYKKVHSAKRRQELRELRLQLALMTVSIMVSTVIFILVVLQAVNGHLSLGDVTLYTSAAGGVLGALTGLSYGFSGLNEQALFFSQFKALQALPQPIEVTPTPRPVETLISEIEFRNVWFRYAEHLPWVLHDFNLKIPVGVCVALVGLNGAGKSTLVKLLTRLYDPTEGKILWDRVDIREFDPDDLRVHMGVVLQDFVRYALPAYENIGLGKVDDISRIAQISQAAMKAGIHEKIKKLPQGYDTTLNRWLIDNADDGVDLSGGEWQGVALARMFMRNANLFILDEPTADLDALAEYDFYERFSKLVTGRTSLLISHRFSTVKMADFIAVIDNGHVTEFGSHKELLRLSGTYDRLYMLQAQRYGQ